MNPPARRYPPLLRLLIPLALASLACQAVMQAFAPPPAPTPLPPPTAIVEEIPAPPATPESVAPTRTAAPALEPAAAATPTLAIPPTLSPTSSPLQRQVFQDLWDAVNENYVYEDFNGVDWQAVYAEYSRKIDAGLSDEDFYAAMSEMIYRLGDDHSTFFTPQEAKEDDAQFAGENDFVGIGILSSVVPERNRITIILVFPNSPAEEAGLQPHDNILAVDGQPIVDEQGFRRNLIRGPEGTTITVTVQTPGQEPRDLQITRRQVSGALPVPNAILTTPGGKRVGYLLIPSFYDDTVDDQVKQILREMNREAPLDGVILDNRQNGGGASTVMGNILSYFAEGQVGKFVSRKESRPLRVRADDIDGSQKVPLVVMVGKNSVSFGEIFSGVLQDIGRAYLIGETTDGNVEILWVYDFDDGSRAWIAYETFRPRNNPDANWEDTGIIPDLQIPVNWDEVTLDTDPAVKAALEHFDQ